MDMCQIIANIWTSYGMKKINDNSRKIKRLDKDQYNVFMSMDRVKGQAGYQTKPKSRSHQ
jgi:hypothetical protein